jgi:hypothetical protein
VADEDSRFSTARRALQILWNWLTDPQRRAALLDIFLNRDYAHYDLIRGTTHTLNNWPLAEDFRLYLRRADQSTTIQADPYAQGWRNTAAVQSWGSIGTGAGQLTSPHGIALAPDGSIYVADGDSQRIQKFDQQGNFVLAFGTPSEANNPSSHGIIQRTVGHRCRIGWIDLRDRHVESSHSESSARWHFPASVGHVSGYQR